MSTFRFTLIALFIVGWTAAMAYEAWEDRAWSRKCVAAFDAGWCAR